MTSSGYSMEGYTDGRANQGWFMILRFPLIYSILQSQYTQMLGKRHEKRHCHTPLCVPPKLVKNYDLRAVSPYASRQSTVKMTNRPHSAHIQFSNSKCNDCKKNGKGQHDEGQQVRESPRGKSSFAIMRGWYTMEIRSKSRKWAKKGKPRKTAPDRKWGKSGRKHGKSGSFSPIFCFFFFFSVILAILPRFRSGAIFHGLPIFGGVRPIFALCTSPAWLQSCSERVSERTFENLWEVAFCVTNSSLSVCLSEVFEGLRKSSRRKILLSEAIGPVAPTRVVPSAFSKPDYVLLLCCRFLAWLWQLEPLATQKNQVTTQKWLLTLSTFSGEF